jgi:hypothetical protein
MPLPKDLNGNPHATFNIGLHDKQIKVDFKPLDSHPLGAFHPFSVIYVTQLTDSPVQSDQIRIHLLGRRSNLGNGLVSFP